MKKVLIYLFFFLSLTDSRSQGNMPPSIVITFGEQNIDKDILIKDFDFVLQHFSGIVKKRDIHTTPVIFDIKTFNYIHPGGININLGTITEHYEHVYPKKGDIIGFYLHEKKSGKNMRLFIRICTDLYVRAVIPLKELEFKEGNYFYDMCSSEAGYEIIFKSLCPEHFKGADVVFDPYLHLRDYESHKIRISRLSRILKKYNCHD